VEGFEFRSLGLPGLVEIIPRIVQDERGRFVKTFRADWPSEYGIPRVFAEEYFSTSRRGVLRGLHFQLPPLDHDKLVYCIDGEVMDVAVDLRLGSPTYGTAEWLTLGGDRANIVFLPRGFAHGFYTLSERATVAYKVTSLWSREHDAGVLWSSVRIPWPDADPCVSERDRGFPALDRFVTPFRYREPGSSAE
jgi:dTDP-4-dehydrorhamnose 3,5-epimerase